MPSWACTRELASLTSAWIINNISTQLGIFPFVRLWMGLCLGQETVLMAAGVPTTQRFKLIQIDSLIIQIFYFAGRYCLLFALIGMCVPLGFPVHNGVALTHILYQNHSPRHDKVCTPMTVGTFSQLINCAHSRINCEVLYTFNQVSVWFHRVLVRTSRRFLLWRSTNRHCILWRTLRMHCSWRRHCHM